MENLVVLCHNNKIFSKLYNACREYVCRYKLFMSMRKKLFFQSGKRIWIHRKTHFMIRGKLDVMKGGMLAVGMPWPAAYFTETELKDHVWIGIRSIILKGVTIGEGAVIAAGSIVTKDVPPRCLAAGSPAKVIRENITWQL